MAGPILLVLTLLHGRSFGADAAAGTLLGLAALTMFVVVYGRFAPWAPPAATVVAGWTAFLVGVALLTLVHPPPLGTLILVAAGFAVGIGLLAAPKWPPTAQGALPWWDLPARAGAALALVVALTAVSGALGPHLSGLLAPFPIITSVLAVFIHGHGGADQVRVLLRNFLVGFYGFAAFLLHAHGCPGLHGDGCRVLACIGGGPGGSGGDVRGSLATRPEPNPQARNREFRVVRTADGRPRPDGL